MAPSRYKKRLLTHIAHATYSPAAAHTLAADLAVPKEDYASFVEAIKELAAAGQVVWGDDQLVTLPPLGRELIGTFRKNPKGFGFVIPRDPIAHGDLFVPAHQTADAMTGDIVRAEVVHSRGGRDDRSPYVGNIVEVLERKRSSYAGEIRKQGGQWLVYPDGKALQDPVVVPDAPSKNVKDGDKVVFELTVYPEGRMLGEGVIVKVLGESGRPDVETQAVIEAYGLPGEFPDACIEQAREQSALFDADMRELEKGRRLDPAARTDLRDEYIITIDPPDAKDYDDAISIERLDPRQHRGAQWRLGVHIADVSHFIDAGSPLDEEAKDRGNSCYLPRLVIPMLPEILSNGICSLQEGVNRYVKSAYIDYDAEGRVRGAHFRAGMIRSAKRLTYLEAQALIDGDQELARTHARTEPRYTEQLISTLKLMDHLSRTIRDRRRKQGMIHLELPDVELVYDEDGRVIDAVPEDDAYTHTLIEMFMVEANEAVARLFEELGVPLLRRTHPDPVPGEMEQLRDYVKVAGYKIPKSPTREELQGLLDATAGSAAAPAVHMAVLRTLTRAEYSPALIGHFALASTAYAHFTSPIRRYADLTVHRALTAFLEITDNGQKVPGPEDDRGWRSLGRTLRDRPECPDEQTLTQIGVNCNIRENNAESAERELRQFLVLQLLENHIGESFPALVTGVAASGVFVRLDKYLAEGLCKVEDLPPPMKDGRVVKFPRWVMDRQSGSLVESNSGRSFNIGDRLNVTIAEIDLARRQMELVITDAGARDVGKEKRLANRLTLGGADELGGGFDRPTGADKRAARSKMRDLRKGDHRSDRKNKGKRQ
ncbi:MAG: VacB/RNase II family 3'-5' exoribonuclease [Planctomycetota bacterium]|nr:VacB/RNase II family 3'-5' exoribonuclease [Planctomycetota bacterium]